MTIEAHVRQAISAAAESTGVKLSEVDSIRLVAVYSQGRLSLACEVDALGQRDLMSSLRGHDEAGLRAPLAALRAVDEPPFTVDPAIPVLDEHGQPLGTAALQNKGRKGRER